jgi:hypothetical protein
MGEGRGGHSSSRSVDRGADQKMIVEEVERRERVDTLDHRRPFVRVSIEQERIDPVGSDHHLDEQVPTVVRQVHIGPRSRRGRVTPDHRIGGRCRSQLVEHDPPVVLIASGITGVVEA